ncbi:unnamed protein product [Sphagnum troendelagicum]
MERPQPLLLTVHAEFRRQRIRSRKAPHALDQSAVPGPPRTVPKHQNTHHHGEQARRGVGHRSRRLLHQKTGRPHGDHRSLGHNEACGLHPNTIYGGRCFNHGNNPPKDSLLRAAEPMPKMSQVRASRSVLQREQAQAPGRTNAPKPPHKLEFKKGLGLSSILPWSKPGGQAGPSPKRPNGRPIAQGGQSEAGSKNLSKSPLRGGKVRPKAKTSANRPSQSKDQTSGVLESSVPDPPKRNPTRTNQKDQVMTERSESPNHTTSFTQAEAEHKINGSQTPKAKLNFGLLGETSIQPHAPETNNNPFASPNNNIGGGGGIVEQNSNGQLGRLDLPRKEKTHSQARHSSARPPTTPPPPPRHPQARDNAGREERPTALRGTPILFHFYRHPGPTKQGAPKSKSVAGPDKGKKLSEGDLGPLQKSSPAESPTPHKTNRAS